MARGQVKSVERSTFALGLVRGASCCEMDKYGRYGCRSKSTDPPNLSKILRASTFEPLDHLIGKAADQPKLQALRNTQGIVVVYSVRRCPLLLDVSAVQRVRQ